VSPVFDSIKIRLPDKKLLELITHKSTADAQYIQVVKWNGRNYDKNYLRHASIVTGGKLDIWLQDQPTTWGSDPKQQPPGLSRNK
jgi:putative alpha-1,2-mannosidase